MNRLEWIYFLCILAGVGLSCGLTAATRRYAIRASLLDMPNLRSSHEMPTPRGGGVAIVISLSLLLIVLRQVGSVDGNLVVAALGAGGLVAGLGFFDDHTSIPARWRFLGHLLAAAWIVWCIGEIPPVPMLGIPVELLYAGPVLCALYIVWMINLFNFMDGIDGIASIETITVCSSGALIWWLAGSDGQWVVPLLLASCVAGFLIWNFPPAKIFMGDVGSGFLGLMVALLSLWCAKNNPMLFWSWFILVGCFVVDATTTLLRRVLRGERFYEAHRSHAYQFASRRHLSHKKISLAIGTINLLWLLPLALAVALGRLDGLAGTLIAYLPLIWLAYHYKAGDQAAQAA